MGYNIEKEIKIALSNEQYKEVERLFVWSETVEQTNYYYIASGNTGMTSIRVREIDSRFYLQVKAPVSEEGALHIKKEFEKILDSVPEVISSEELSELTGGKLPDARLAGSLHTCRRLCRDFVGVEICLDKSDYLGRTDYELELEYTGEYPSALIDKLEHNGVRADGVVAGKYARFLAALKENSK